MIKFFQLSDSQIDPNKKSKFQIIKNPSTENKDKNFQKNTLKPRCILTPVGRSGRLTKYMIYLIGGAPRTGKSTIAKQFAKFIDGRFVSTDELEDPSQDQSVFFSDDATKNILAPKERLESVINDTNQIIHKIDNIINAATSNNEVIVIEGVHLFPKYVSDLIKKFGEKNLKAIFIGSSDIELMLQGMNQNTSPNNWPKNFSQEVKRQIATFTKAFSDYIEAESKKYNLQYKKRSDNFQKDTNEVIERLK